MKIELIEQFKAAFTDSLVYADLATEYTSYEIFEVNNGKFELDTVQQAWESWSKQNGADVKRAQFTKDLNKLVSGDYVLVPRDSAQFCAEKTIDHVHDNIREFGANTELEAEWKAHAHALMTATGDTRYEN